MKRFGWSILWRLGVTLAVATVTLAVLLIFTEWIGPYVSEIIGTAALGVVALALAAAVTFRAPLVAEVIDVGVALSRRGPALGSREYWRILKVTLFLRFAARRAGLLLSSKGWLWRLEWAEPRLCIQARINLHGWTPQKLEAAASEVAELLAVDVAIERVDSGFGIIMLDFQSARSG